MPYRGNESVFEYNYIETIKRLVPNVYLTEDLKNGKEEDTAYSTVGKFIVAADEWYTFFSSVSGLSSSAIIQRYIPSNRMTRVTPDVFQSQVLNRFKTNFVEFETSAAFHGFLVSSVLPQIHLNSPSESFIAEAASATVNRQTTPGDVHRSLVSGLGLAYFLNTTSVSDATMQLSSVLASSLAHELYYGNEFTERDAAHVLFEYMWRNKDDVALFPDRYLPPAFASATSSLSGGTYTSGLQNLYALKTNLDVWLNSYDEDSSYLSDALDKLASSNIISTKYDSAGPLQKFLKGTSYGFYELEMIVESLQDLIDLENCPDKFLEYLSELIAWKFLGGDATQWRTQLRQAVYTYKAKGTRQALEDAITYVFPKDVSSFSSSSDILTSYESYFPNLLYYTLKTESPFCQDPEGLREFMQGMRAYNPSGLTINIDPFDHDKNIRFCVDAILEALHMDTNFININGNRDLSSMSHGVGFTHRGGYTTIVPPWEKDTFYKTTTIPQEMLKFLRKILLGNCVTETGLGFNIPPAFLNCLLEYINTYTNVNTEVSGQFYFGNNNLLKFFTSAHHLPCNWSGVLTSGNSDHLSVVDYWNTKSSYIFVRLPDNCFEGPTPLNAQDVGRVARVLEEFIPFHALSRIYASKTFSGTHKAFNMGDAGMGIKIWHYLQDNVINQYHSHTTSAFVGTRGQGGLYDIAKIVRPFRVPNETAKFVLPPDSINFGRYDAPGWGDLYSGKGYNLSAYIPNASGDVDMITGDYIPPLFLFNHGGAGISPAASAGALWQGERFWNAATQFGFISTRNNTSAVTVSSIPTGDYVSGGGSIPNDVHYQLISSANITTGWAGTSVILNPYWFRAAQKYNISFYYRSTHEGGTADQRIQWNFKQGRPYGSDAYTGGKDILVEEGDSTWDDAWHHHSADFIAPTEPAPWNPLGVASALAGDLTYGSDYGEKSQSYLDLWSHTGGTPTATENGIAIAGLSIKPVYWEVSGGIDRVDTRRRNWRYLIEGSRELRNGAAQPFSMGFFSTSALTSLETTNDFIPKGFNFSGQNYISPRINSLSSIYDTSNSPVVQDNRILYPAPSGTLLNYDISSVFPARAMDPIDVSSTAELRSRLSNLITQIFIDYHLRKGKEDKRFLNFSDENIRFTNFGEFHDVWNIYRAASGFEYSLDGSGFSVLDHVYGPGLYNNSFQERGALNNPSLSGVPAYTEAEGNADVKLGLKEFLVSFGSDGLPGTAWLDAQGALLPFENKGLLFRNGRGSYINHLDSYLYPGAPIYTNEAIVSGVSVLAHEGTNAVGVLHRNDIGDQNSCSPWSFSSLDDKSVTVYGGKDAYVNSSSPLKFRFPLLRSPGLLSNGDFEQKPILTPYTETNATASSIRGWNLLDGDRFPYWGQGETVVARASVETLNRTSPSAVTVVKLQGKPVAGMYGGDRSALRSSPNGSLTGESRNPIPLVSNTLYRISYDVSSSELSGGVGFALLNNSRDVFLQDDGSWDTPVNFVRPQDPPYVSGFYTVSSEFLIPVSAQSEGSFRMFSPDDSYTVILQRDPSGSALAGNVGEEYVKEIKLYPLTANTIFPDKRYRIRFKLNYIDPTNTTPRRDSIGVRVFGGPTNNAHSTNRGELFEFDFRANRWKITNPEKSISLEDAYPMPIRMTTSSLVNQTFEMDFHTLNALGPMDDEIRQPLYIRKGERYRNIHNIGFPYTVEFTPLLPERNLTTDAQRPAMQFYDMELIDLDLHKVVTDDKFIRSEAKKVLEYFDTLNAEISTRVLGTAESLGLGTKGGARALYLEEWGGLRKEPDTGGSTIYTI